MSSDVSDNDEDVILPNSPLNQYIHEFETIEDDTLTENEELPVLKYDVFSKPIDIKGKLCYIGRFVTESFKLYLSFIYNIFVPCLIPFEFSELKYILNAAKNSKVLIAEDLSVLLNYESDDESNAEFKLSYSSVIQQCFQFFAFVMIFFIVRFISLSNIISNEDLINLFSDKTHFICISLQFSILIISVTLYLNIFLISAFIISNFIELLFCKIFCYSIKKKVHTTECIMIMIRKCLRLLQEAELVARGFTSASVPSVAERLELSTGLPIASPQRQYPELRKSIYIWTKEVFLQYKNSTLKLLENKTFGPVLDFSSQSFAMLDLKEFGSLLKYDINFHPDLLELLKTTDGLSISSLKTMYLLLEFQISEFYKYLYLITSFLISDGYLFNCPKKIKYFYCLNSFVKYLQAKDTEILKMSCETHKYYKSIEAVAGPEKKIFKNERSSDDHFSVWVHNMSLRLKAALKKVADLEEFLDTEKSSDRSKDEKYLKKIDDMMKNIDSEIEAYHDYYLKCDNEVQISLFGSPDKYSPTDSSNTENNEVQNETSIPKTVAFCDLDPVIEDEVFEALVTKSCEGTEFSPRDYPSEKQSFEVAGKLLRELKNVLTLKADEHRVREENAMAKKNINSKSTETNVSDKLDDLNAQCCLSKLEQESKESLSESESSLSDLEVSNLTSDYKKEKSKFSIEDANENIQSSLLTTKNPFAASIAALALQRQKKLGIGDEICFSDSVDSDEEINSN